MTTIVNQPVRTAFVAASPRRPACFRGALLLIGAGGLGVLSAWARLLNHGTNGFVLADDRYIAAQVPTIAIAAVLFAALLGGAGLLWSLFADLRLRFAAAWAVGWARSHRWSSLLIFVAAALGAVDVYQVFYDPARRVPGHFTYQLRDDLRLWLCMGAVVLIALAVSPLAPASESFANVATRLRTQLVRHRAAWWLLAIAIPVVLGFLMSVGALNRLPHFSDSLTYLIQGRMLLHGRLSIATPQYPQLWQKSLFFVISPDHQRFFSKYPIGWPAILGLFDWLHVAFLANVLLGGLIVLLTGLVAREVCSRRVAILAALVMGLSPWLWFSVADMASHPASTCALTAFLWLFLRTLRNPRTSWAIACGLALASAVLIRPSDALCFAAPVIAVTLWLLLRHPARWLAPAACIGLAALLGVGIYLWCNYATTGHALLSPYKLEGRWGDDWNPAWRSMRGRFEYQWSELNEKFPGNGPGGLTLAVVGSLVFCQQRRRHPNLPGSWRGRGLWLLIAGAGVFFVVCTAFAGLANVWWGPRWLLPVAPVLAILIAIVLDMLLYQARRRQETAAPAQLALCLALGAVVVGLTIRYGGQFYQNRLIPPHRVSAAVPQRLGDLGYQNSVVAMPGDGPAMPPIDVRAGLAFMTVPLDANPIVYVRSVPGWQAMAAQMFPGRRLYEVHEYAKSADGFRIEDCSPVRAH
jgi:hypothetical protein